MDGDKLQEINLLLIICNDNSIKLKISQKKWQIYNIQNTVYTYHAQFNYNIDTCIANYVKMLPKVEAFSEIFSEKLTQDHSLINFD